SMATPDKRSPLSQEQKELSKPLGLKRPLSWLIAVPVFLAFLVLPWLASQYPAQFESVLGSPVQAEASDPQPSAEVQPPVNAHPSFFADAQQSDRKKTFMSLDSVWNPGPLASAHQAWEGDCQACHNGNFSRVTDESCNSCHGNMGLHVSEQTLPETNFAEPRCATCHRDHKGLESLAEQNKHFVGQDCADCHANIEQSAPKTETLPVKGFDGTDHPAFRITMRSTEDAASLIRVRMKQGEMLSEPTTLRFPHDVHMNPKGLESRTRVEVLECASCHETADTETGFKPIEMEAHCQSCHSLAFEPALPDREVPHGASGPVLDTIVEFYSFLKQNPQMQADVARVRDTYLARPGASNKPRASVKASALVQAEGAAQDLFENRACAVCHEVSISEQPVTKQTSGSKLTQYTVAEVPATHPWMPMARFDHKAHEFDSCESCHQATK
ncbi:MAG: hypothetical protein R3194_12570, partial [Limnobacter sp.]|nr:hypothetical protein [Limnobacter sp.]